MYTRKEKIIMIVSAIVCIASLLPWYFGKGTFNEDTYERICSNIVIGGTKVSMPFTLNDLGDDYYFDDTEEYKGFIYTKLMHNGKTAASVSAYVSGDDEREYPINSIIITDDPGYYGEKVEYDTDLINSISADGLRLGASERTVRRKYGDPVDIDTEGCYELCYYQYPEKYNGGIITVSYDFNEEKFPKRLQGIHIFYHIDRPQG